MSLLVETEPKLKGRKMGCLPFLPSVGRAQTAKPCATHPQIFNLRGHECHSPVRSIPGGVFGMARRVPLFPCLCVALAMALLAMTLLGSQLPEDEAFVNSGTPSTRGGNVAMQGRKFTAADRGTPEYEEYFRKKKEVKKAAWERMTTANGYRDAGVDIPGLSAPAPAPSAPAPSPMSSGGGESGGGNPFQFIIDLFNPTTTTTTTTPPPNPIEAFFKGLR
ncbi:unnamed protein product [Effrenium voratum]|nr:unnamed protein product [Effrenium voratum]